MNTTRKHFLRQLTVATAALALPKLYLLAKKLGYTTVQNNNVTYYTKSATQYDTLRKGFNKRINKYPKIIAVCTNTQGVVEALQYAKKEGLKVTIKSGGHCMEGFSCLQDGMVINLLLLNNISIDGNTLIVQPAATLKAIYEKIIPLGKYLPGGSCQSVAIGGLTLGGGYGLLSRTYGLTADSLLQATMVDGSGTIVTTANNEELLWALRGGGNGNFGVVTEMRFKLQKAPNTLTSYKFRTQNATLTKAKAICEQWFIQTKTLPNSCFSAFIFNGKTTYILLTNTDKNNTAVNTFINYFEAQSTKVTKGNPLPLGTALKAYYAEANPITFKNASAGLYKSFNDVAPCINQVFALLQQSPGLLYQVNTLGGAIQNDVFVRNSSFPHRDCFYFSELQAYWDSPTATAKKLQQFEAIQQQFAKAGVQAQYRNYPDINFNNWQTAYYGNSLPRLLAIKKKYDAGNIFGGEQTLSTNLFNTSI